MQSSSIDTPNAKQDWITPKLIVYGGVAEITEKQWGWGDAIVLNIPCIGPITIPVPVKPISA